MGKKIRGKNRKKKRGVKLGTIKGHGKKMERGARGIEYTGGHG